MIYAICIRQFKIALIRQFVYGIQSLEKCEIQISSLPYKKYMKN